MQSTGRSCCTNQVRARGQEVPLQGTPQGIFQWRWIQIWGRRASAVFDLTLEIVLHVLDVLRALLVYSGRSLSQVQPPSVLLLKQPLPCPAAGNSETPIPKGPDHAGQALCLALKWIVLSCPLDPVAWSGQRLGSGGRAGGGLRQEASLI